MCPKDADGMVNSEDPDQTAHSVWSDPDQTAPSVWSRSTLFAQTCLLGSSQ